MRLFLEIVTSGIVVMAASHQGAANDDDTMEADQVGVKPDELVSWSIGWCKDNTRFDQSHNPYNTKGRRYRRSAHSLYQLALTGGDAKETLP